MTRATARLGHPGRELTGDLHRGWPVLGRGKGVNAVQPTAGLQQLCATSRTATRLDTGVNTRLLAPGLTSTP